MEEKVNMNCEKQTGEKPDLMQFMETEMGYVPNDPSQYSPLVLAYIGDCVYELFIRTKLVSYANMQVNKLNKLGSSFACAKTQCLMAEVLDEILSEEEKRLIQRGKNAKVGTVPKSCTAKEYHLATGFECMLGYLYLTKQSGRIAELIRIGFEKIDSIQN